MDTDTGEKSYRPGVGMMVLNRRHQVLLCRRLGTPDGWQMPQGGIDEGEEPRTAALRELNEEIGTDKVEVLAETKDWLRYDLPPEFIGKARHGRYAGQRQRWFLMRFTGRDDEIRLDTVHPEFDEWMWVAPASIPDLTIAFRRQLYRQLLEEFRDLLREGDE
jgi:putative (di)nucleoside polyphosphate hydrolase